MWEKPSTQFQGLLHSFINHDCVVVEEGQIETSMEQNRELRKKHAQMIFDKYTKAIQLIKDGLFNKWYWSKWLSTGKNMSPNLLYLIEKLT